MILKLGLSQIEGSKDGNDSDAFMEEYFSHEGYICSEGLKDGTILPLKTTGVVHATFSCFHPDNFERETQTKTYIFGGKLYNYACGQAGI